MKASRYILALALALVIVFASVGTIAAEESFTMTIQAQSYVSEFPSNDAEVLLKIEEYTGVHLDIIWMVGNLSEKISTTLASGADMPMCLYISSAWARIHSKCICRGLESWAEKPRERQLRPKAATPLNHYGPEALLYSWMIISYQNCSRSSAFSVT